MGIFLLLTLLNLNISQTVSGTVKDSQMCDELMLVHVSTSIDETYTDVNGRYTINFVKGDSITFDYVGYNTKTVCVENCSDVLLDY